MTDDERTTIQAIKNAAERWGRYSGLQMDSNAAFVLAHVGAALAGSEAPRERIS